MMSILLLLCFLQFCKMQDYLLTPEKIVNITRNKEKGHTEQFLLELEKGQDQMHIIIEGQMIGETSFFVVRKDNPYRNIDIRNKCIFDANNYYCKVNIRDLNQNTQLLKVKVECIQNCRFNMILSQHEQKLRLNNTNDSFSDQWFFIPSTIIGFLILTTVCIGCKNKDKNNKSTKVGLSQANIKMKRQ